MFNVKNMLYVVIFVIDVCQSLTSFDHQEYFDKLITSVVIISNKTPGGLLDETMVQYGSIIHHKYVLTLAEILKGKNPNDLLVHFDCYSDWFIFQRSCFSQKEVSRFKFIPNNYPYSIEIEPKYGIMVFKNSILFTPRMKVVSLVTNDDIVDKSNCLAYSYIHHEKSNSFVSYVTPVKFQESGRCYLPTSTNIARLIHDNGREMELERIVSKVSFYGSPIMCSLQNSTDYVQVGISNLKTILHQLDPITLSRNILSINQLSVNFSKEEINAISSFILQPTAEKYSVLNILS